MVLENDELEREVVVSCAESPLWRVGGRLQGGGVAPLGGGRTVSSVREGVGEGVGN